MNDSIAIAILAAGKGTRLKSKLAKVLHSAGGRPLVGHAVRTARTLVPQGNGIFVIVGHQAEAVIDEVRKTSGAGEIQFVHQTEQNGTGHAMQCGRVTMQPAAQHLMVCCGDTPLLRPETLKGLYDAHIHSKATATVMSADLPDPSGYGRIVRDKDGSLAAIVEHKSATEEQRRICEINTGVYCFETADLFRALDQVKPDKITGEYYLTDVIGLLRAEGKKVMAHKIADAAETIGINNRVELAQVDALLRSRKTHQLMMDGVTIIRPETVQIDPDVQVGADTIIEQGVSLIGNTSIGQDCRIGAYTVITDCELGNGIEVKQSCIFEKSKVSNGAILGPFARLRPESEIGPGAHIGNFVEVKKSRVGKGSKANHLTYIGDATIGENVNIGAGTITCNYDGAKKHPTIIEDNVFIGSDSALVAPVRIGKNAYVGAGSTITEDVPDDSLGLARGRQANKIGWVSARKAKAGKNC